MSSFTPTLRSIIQFIASCVRWFRAASTLTQIATIVLFGLALWFGPQIVSMIWGMITTAIGETLSAILPYIILAVIGYAVLTNND